MKDTPDEPDFSEQVYDASDEQHVDRRRKAAGKKAHAEKEFLMLAMADRAGRAWLWKLISGCGIFCTSFTADPYKTAFQEGQRNIGLMVLGEIMSTAPELYSLMYEENK